MYIYLFNARVGTKQDITENHTTENTHTTFLLSL